MKIIKLQAENIKRLKAITIEPQSNTVVISGRNGAGKSSVLDAIWYALGGGPATKDTVRPIRDGQESASVTLDLGDYIVTRTWTANDKSYLKVENRDGARFPSPQAMLDKLVGKLSFDPLAFAQMDERAQVQALMSVVTLDEDPAELDNQRLRLFEERTQVNRQAKQLEGQLAGMPEPAAGLPAEEVGAASIMAEIEHANRQIRANDTKRAEFRSAESGAQTAQAQLANYDYEIKQAEARLAQLRESYARATKGLLEARALVNRLLTETEALCDPDLSSYRQRLAEVEQTNRQIRAAAQRTATSEALAAAQKQSDNLSAQIRAIDDRKAQAIRKAAFPVEGLAFDSAGVTYKDIPFKQCSSAEQLRVSMAVAMALNPRIRVLRITDGSLLDSNNMRVIEEMAEDRDFQVWLERVDESGKVGIYIEDGEVRTAPTQGELFPLPPNPDTATVMHMSMHVEPRQ